MIGDTYTIEYVENGYIITKTTPAGLVYKWVSDTVYDVIIRFIADEMPVSSNNVLTEAKVIQDTIQRTLDEINRRVLQIARTVGDKVRNEP